MVALSEKQLPPLGPWPLGVDNFHKENALPRDKSGKLITALRRAMNCDIDDNGKVRRRKGTLNVIEGTFCHSLWSERSRFPQSLYVDNGTLKAFDDDYTVTDVLTGLSVNDPLYYESANNRVFFSDGFHTGTVLSDLSVQPWGVPSPGGQPTLTTVSNWGGLFAGKYQVAVTFLNSFGEESGSTLATEIQLQTDGGGIQATNIPQPPSGAGVQYVRIYISTPSGPKLYWLTDLPTGITSYAISNSRLGRLLDTQFMQPFPGCTLLHRYNGRIYGAVGRAPNIMAFTDNLRYGLGKPQVYRRYPTNISMIHRAQTGPESGLYVGTADRVYFHAGGDPGKFEESSRSEAYAAGVVNGSVASVPGEALGLDGVQKDFVPVWLGTDGIFCAGLPQGQVMPLTKDRLVLPKFAAGRAVYRTIPDIKQVMFSMTGMGAESTAAAQDAMTISVQRNGITLP